MLKKILRPMLRSMGYDLIRFSHASHPEARRMKLLARHGITTVLDVGANTGQYVDALRREGYTDKVISFEPLSAIYRVLEANAAKDPAWTAHAYALGDEDGEQEINVSENTCSSSILDMKAEHEASAPKSRYVGKETIRIQRLDSVFDDLVNDSETVYLKIDTQGYLTPVLEGAKGSLSRIVGLQVEVSLIELYQGEMLIEDIVRLVRGYGFVPMSIEPGFSDPESGQLLQADIVFYRPDAS